MWQLLWLWYYGPESASLSTLSPDMLLQKLKVVNGQLVLLGHLFIGRSRLGVAQLPSSCALCRKLLLQMLPGDFHRLKQLQSGILHTDTVFVIHTPFHDSRLQDSPPLVASIQRTDWQQQISCTSSSSSASGYPPCHWPCCYHLGDLWYLGAKVLGFYWTANIFVGGSSCQEAMKVLRVLTRANWEKDAAVQEGKGEAHPIVA